MWRAGHTYQRQGFRTGATTCAFFNVHTASGASTTQHSAADRASSASCGPAGAFQRNCHLPD